MSRWLALVFTGLLLTAAVASAQVPLSISYQGVITDNTGALVPDGAYDLTVRLYESSLAGAAVFTETHTATAVTKGGFSILLGSVAPLTLAFDKPYWLSLQVGADPELTPRVPLASSPYALSLKLPFTGSAASLIPTFTLRNSGGGLTLLADGTMQVGSSANAGRLEVHNSGNPDPIASIGAFAGHGGQMRVNDEGGGAVVRMEPDAAGTGGFFTVMGGTAGTSVYVDGSGTGGEPTLRVNGTSRDVLFDMGQVGTASVQLPSSAVEATEMLNEPGLAAASASAFIQLTGGVSVITSRTITVPDDGYVVAIGGSYLSFDHINGQFSRVIMGVSDVNSGFANTYTKAEWFPANPTCSYMMPASHTGVFPVTPGAHTFYLLGQEVNVQGQIGSPSLTLMYFPTAYGTVTSTKMAGASAKPAEGSPMTVGDVADEQREAASFDRARLERELSQMRERLDAMQKSMASDPQAAAAAAAVKK